MGGALLLSNGGHGHGEELDKQGRGEREMTPERVESERLGMGTIWCGLASTLDEQGRMAVELAMVGAPSLHGGRVGISSSTWRATKRPAWEAILGLFRAELDHGPKMKFAQLGLLSNFY